MVRIPSFSRRGDAAPTQDENRDGVLDERDARRAEDRTRPADDRARYVGDADRVAPTSPAVGSGAGAPVVTDRAADQTTYRSAAADPDGPADRSASERRAAERAAIARAATTRSQSDTGAHPVIAERSRSAAADADQTVDTRPADSRAGNVRDTEPERTGTPVVEPDVVVARGPRPRTSLLATLSLILGVAAVLFVLTGTLAGYGMVLGGLGALLGVAGLSATRRRHVAGTSEAALGVLLGLAALVLGILAMTGQFGWPSTAGDWVPRFREWLDTQFVDRF